MLGALGYVRVYTARTLLVIVLAELVFIPSPFSPDSENRSAFGANPPAWSLAFEMLINFVYGLAVRYLNDRRLLFVVLGSGLSFVATAAYLGTTILGPFWPGYCGGLGRVAFSFFAGVDLFRLWRRGLLAPLRAPFPFVVSVLLLVMAFPVLPRGNVFYDLAIMLGVLPTLVAFGAVSQLNDRGGRMARVAGELSYPVYILQGGFVTHIRDLPLHLGLGGVAALAVLAGCCCIYILFAWMTLVIFDRPLRSWLAGPRASLCEAPAQMQP